VNSKLKKQKLVKKLTDKEYRHAWTEESIKMLVPYQIQANREKRDWSQAILGRESNMLQNAISRLESMDYGNLTINTLLRLAYGFDCGLLVKFVPFSRLVQEFEDVSPEALQVEGFSDDRRNLQQWVQGVERAAKKRVSRSEHLPSPQLNLFDATENIVFAESEHTRGSVFHSLNARDANTGRESLYTLVTQDLTGAQAS
jgi:transcriptional regulator with XRE-family HTH domain